jgi:hypothetical protein
MPTAPQQGTDRSAERPAVYEPPAVRDLGRLAEATGYGGELGPGPPKRLV